MGRTLLREPALVALFVLFAATRTFLFAAALPFFNGVDEHVHFDLVSKYARGFLPGGENATLDASTVHLMTRFASPEYLKGTGAYPDGRFPTPAEMQTRQAPGTAGYRGAMARYTRSVNYEADAAPTYYAIAATWLHLGRGMGLRGLDLLYWMRWINPLLAATAVFLTWRFLRTRFPQDPFRRLGPCVLLAGWPNDLQYGITPDVLSVGLGALCFFGIVRVVERSASVPVFAATGLAIGVAFLNKYPNVVFAGIAAIACLFAAREAHRAGALRVELARWSALWIAAAAPAVWWLARNALVVGSLTGQHRKVAHLGWTYNDLSGVLAHPLTGLRGWCTFLPNLFSTFWQGEFAWHGRTTHSDWVDLVYSVSSLAFVGFAAWAWLRGARPRIDTVALSALGGSVALLAALSMVFDYGIEKGTLSRAYPYLASGRLIAGALIPFAVAYCGGLQYACRRLPPAWARNAPWAVLLAVLALGLSWQTYTLSTAFGSSWNWFHAG